MKQAAKTPSPGDAPQFERRIAHDYFVRFHMSVILAAVISSGVLTSKGLMLLGVSLTFRYPIAVLASYCVFLLLVRVWIWYVSVRVAGGLQLANLNSGGGSGSGGSISFGGGGGSGGSSSGGGFSGFGGGTSGGGGASSSWEGNDAAALISQPSHVSSGGHWWPDIDLGGGGDDDGWLVVLLLAALVACILGGGVYLVYAAPHILPEAACQVVLASTLTRVSKEEHHNWMAGVIWSTWIPFLLVLLMAGALGWEAHRHCPEAHRLLEVLNCRQA
jgi:hypothetical protein